MACCVSHRGMERVSVTASARSHTMSQNTVLREEEYFVLFVFRKIKGSSPGDLGNPVKLTAGGVSTLCPSGKVSESGRKP